MSCHDIDFVAFDRAGKGHRGLAINDPLPQLLDHRPSVILVDVEFLGDLQPRQVQTHEIQASYPGLERLVVVGEDSAGQVVEAAPAGVALVALAVGLGVIPTVLDDAVRRAMGAGHAVGPTHGPNRLVALGVVDEVLDVHHRLTSRDRVAGQGRAMEIATTTADYNDFRGVPNPPPCNPS